MLTPPKPTEVTVANFEREVMDRSRTTVVVIDFWAPWCAPCRTLAPLLEAEVARRGTGAVLVKVNTDASPELAQAFGVQSIPLVVAVKNGRPEASFVGAQTREFIAGWLDKLAPAVDAPPEEDKSPVERAKAALAAGDEAGAEAILRAQIETEPGDTATLFELGRLCAGRGDTDEARELLGRVPANSEFEEAARQQLEMLALIDAGLAAGGLAAAEARVAADPRDPEARFALAGALWLEGRAEEAFDALIELVRRHRAYREDGARRALVALFGHLGNGVDLVEAARSRLAMVLFS